MLERWVESWFCDLAASLYPKSPCNRAYGDNLQAKCQLAYAKNPSLPSCVLLTPNTYLSHLGDVYCL